MKLATLAILISTLFIIIMADLAPLYQTLDVVKGQYIINLKENTNTNLEDHINSVKELFTKNEGINEIKYVYSDLGTSYSAKFSAAVLEKVRNLPEVSYIETDGVAKIKVAQKKTIWGLARISERTKLGSKGPYTYNYNGNGAGVAVYVIDTGILTTHPEFEGRAVHGASFPSGIETDDNGHGTHCAGTVGSKSYGVSKKASLIGVKVLDASGSGEWSDIIAGINWAAKDKRGRKGNVASMSLGGEMSRSINNAVKALYKKGFVAVVAAGNENQDACNSSPASTPEAITVGAIDIEDSRASFSNYGKCVDVFAPGAAILSTWNDDSTNTLSGTSMACPHVAGLAAYYLSKETLTNAQITKKIISSATKDAITDHGDDSPNLLAYNGFQ